MKHFSHAVPDGRLRQTYLLFAAAILSSLLPGCAGLEISHRPTGSTSKLTQAPGVPFFAKKARCRQEVVWFEPIYTLDFAALIPDKDGTLQAHPRGTVVLPRSNFESADVTNLIKLLNNRPSDEGTVKSFWDKVVALADPKVLSRDFGSLGTKDRILVGRSAAPAVFVDYAEQYYVNAKAPLAGSANLDAKVADDGSLSELSSQLENKTFETIVSALPVGSVITGELGLTGKSVAPANEIEAFQVTISVSGYRHTLAKFVDFPSGLAPCPVTGDITLSEAAEYKREDMSAASNGQQDQKNKGNNSDQTKKPTGSNQDQKSSNKNSQGG